MGAVRALASLAARPIDWTDVPLTRETIKTFVDDALHNTEQVSEHDDVKNVGLAICEQIERPLTHDEGAYMLRMIKSYRLSQHAMRVRRLGRQFAR